MANEFKIVDTVLQFCGVILLTALLMTPAHRHPIVNSMVILSIMICILGILPPLLFLSSAKYQQSLTNLEDHPGWLSFCTAVAVLLNYMTIVKSAFSMSFTMPCLYLACKLTGDRDRLEAQTKPQFYRRTIIVLCVAPFLWAVPLIIELAPKFKEPLSLDPKFVGQMCIIQNKPGQILALLLTLIPLSIAVIASMILIFILCKCYRLPDLRRSFAVLQPIRILRFAVLLITIIVSAILYAVVVAVWVRNLRDPAMWGFALEAWLSTSATWESVSSVILFFIFAAHEDIYSVWWQWIRRWLPRWGLPPHDPDEGVMTHGPKKAFTARGPFRIFAWLSDHRIHAEEGEEQDHCDSAVALGNTRGGGKYWENPAGENRSPRVFTRQIMQISCAPFAPTHDLRGLPPPPRSRRSWSQSPRESAVFRAVPSLSALGPKGRATSESRKHRASSRLLDDQVSLPQAKADDREDRHAKVMRLTPSDEGQSKGEVTTRTDDVVTQFSAISSGEPLESRAASAAATTAEGLDLTGTFGVVSPNS